MTTKIETLTDVERHQLPLYTPYLGSKTLRIIDAHAAERAALTEQVAQLTREQVRLEGLLSPYCWKIGELESEVARLTEALAAAEKKQSDTERWRGWERDRAEAAERDRDAANALLRRHIAPSSNGIGDDSLFAETRAHLSGQPAAPDAVKQTWFSIGGADISLGSIKTALSLAGLHVVTAADKAVLEACEALSHSDLLDARDDGRPKWNRFAHAELARRGAK